MLTPLFLSHLSLRQLFSGPDDLPLLRSRMDALESAWQLEHEASSRNLTYGLWPPGSSTVEVLLRRSKGWNAFGRTQGQRTLLNPEEALFLMESDRLLAFRAVGDHAPMSLHAGYAAAAAVGLTSERYAVFAHLCRLGFIVRRHSKASLRGEEDAADGPNAAQEPQLPTVEDLATGATAAAARGGRGPDGAAAAAGEAEQLEQGAHAPGSVLGGEHGTHAPVDGAASDTPCRGWWHPSAGWPQGQAAAPVLLDALPSEAQACADAWRPELLYDVWTTARMCGKKWASRPIFRVVMSTHRPPTAEEMVTLARENGDVSLKCIVVKPGIVIGFDFGVVTSNTTPKQKGNR